MMGKVNTVSNSSYK